MTKNNSKHYVEATVLASIGLTSLTLLAGLGLASAHTFADDSVVSNASVTVPVSCMMTGTVNTAHDATINAGTYSGTSTDYANGIGKTTLTAYCNDNNGFSIYAIGFTGDSYDGENHTKLVGANTSLTISTKVYESTDTASNWSMKVTKVTDSTQSYNPTNMSITNSFDNWHVVPDSYTRVAQYKATSGSSTTDQGQGALGAKVETTYASYIAPTQAADTYSGKVKYTMVHPYDNTPADGPMSNCPPATICYSRGANDAIGTMGYQTKDDHDYDLTEGASVTLLGTNFSRDDYGFVGWSDKHDYSTNPDAHFYGPMETIIVSEDTITNGLPLYAVWVASTGSLQDSTKLATLCGTGPGSLTQAPTDGTANLSSVAALTDQRDGETYAIAKLADGNCWMIENLRLKAEKTRGTTNQSLAQGYGTSVSFGSFIGLADSESAGFSSTYSPNSMYTTDGSNGTVNIGAYRDPGYRMPRYNDLNTPEDVSKRPNNPTENTFTWDSVTPGMFSYGNYYSWPAAIADTSPHESIQNIEGTSICPVGWRLPTGETDGEIKMLNDSINNSSTESSVGLRRYPGNFIYSGEYNENRATGRGNYGYYTTSSAYNWINTRSLNFTRSSVDPATTIYQNKSRGRSIRCIINNH